MRGLHCNLIRLKHKSELLIISSKGEYSDYPGAFYFQINSASYYWTDDADHYSNGHMIEYKDALYAFVTIDLDSNQITVEGVKSEFLPPAPKPEDFKDADKVYPYISDRVINI